MRGRQDSFDCCFCVSITRICSVAAALFYSADKAELELLRELKYVNTNHCYHLFVCGLAIRSSSRYKWAIEPWVECMVLADD